MPSGWETARWEWQCAVGGFYIQDTLYVVGSASLNLQGSVFSFLLDVVSGKLTRAKR